VQAKNTFKSFFKTIKNTFKTFHYLKKARSKKPKDILAVGCALPKNCDLRQENNYEKLNLQDQLFSYKRTKQIINTSVQQY
jgi:hypothetical protein